MKTVNKRHHNRRVYLLLLCLTGFSSCWFPCGPGIYGKVLDDSTGKPLDSVQIYLYEDAKFVKSVQSDSAGTFLLSVKPRSVFATKKCTANIRLVAGKSGYVDREYYGIAPAMDIEIRLEK